MDPSEDVPFTLGEVHATLREAVDSGVLRDPAGGSAPPYSCYDLLRNLKGLKEGKQIHGHAWILGIQSDLCIETALMDMYSKCGCLNVAMKILEAVGMVNEVSMTVTLAGFAQNGCDFDSCCDFDCI